MDLLGNMWKRDQNFFRGLKREIGFLIVGEKNPIAVTRYLIFLIEMEKISPLPLRNQ